MAFWDRQQLKMWDKNGGLFIMLPSKFKKAGMMVMFISAASFFFINYYELEMKEVWIGIAGNFFLIGLLLIILSKEKNEDERITQLRLKSLSFSFVMTILNILIVPLILILFEFIIQSEQIVWNGNWSSFLTILSLQLYYLICFYRLKTDL